MDRDTTATAMLMACSCGSTVVIGHDNADVQRRLVRDWCNGHDGDYCLWITNQVEIPIPEKMRVSTLREKARRGP